MKDINVLKRAHKLLSDLLERLEIYSLPWPKGEGSDLSDSSEALIIIDELEEIISAIKLNIE